MNSDGSFHFDHPHHGLNHNFGLPPITWVDDLLVERAFQDRQHGGPANDDRKDWYDWRGLIYKQLTALSMEGTDNARRERLVKVAALAVAAMQSMDRKKNNG